jgi:hypothetical protein
MKESKISRRFEEVVAEMRGTPENQRLLRYLGDIRDAVRDIQEAGIEAALAVRPGEYKCAIPPDNSVKTGANGTVAIDGLEVNFVLELRSDEYVRLRAFVDKESVAFQYFSRDDDIKQVFTDVLLKVKARFSVVDEFTLDKNGNVATSKDFPVSPPLKLKPKPDLSL